MMHLVQDQKPNVIVVDPISALEGGGSLVQANMMVLRLVDYLKMAGATTLYLSVKDADETANLNIASLMDSWIAIKNVQGERDLERQLFIIKSRGMSHSADVRKLFIKRRGGADLSERRGT